MFIGLHVKYPLFLSGFNQCVISGFCLEVDENCPLLGYYTASSGNFYMMFWVNLSVEDRTNRFSRNISNKLSVLSTQILIKLDSFFYRF